MKSTIKFLLISLAILFAISAYGQTQIVNNNLDVQNTIGKGIRFWKSENYKIHMGTGTNYQYGPVTGYSIKTNMNNDASRGWTWGVVNAKPVAALSTTGELQIKNNLRIETGNIKGIRPNGVFKIYANNNGFDGSYISLNGDNSSGSEGKISLVAGQGGGQGGDIAFLNKTPSGWSENMKIVGNGGRVNINHIGDANTQLMVGSPKKVGLSVQHTYNSDWGYGIKSVVSRTNTKAIGVVNTQTNADVFRVMGDGKVWAKEVEVKLPPFPDYVFEKDYELLSIEAVEKHILENKHLPGFPSAKEIEANGIGLGVLQVKNVEKIEELTLYIIEINKRLERLEKENKTLKAELSEISTSKE